MINQLLEKLRPQDTDEYSLDYDHFGRVLIRYFQPYLQELREEKPRKVILLNDLKSYFKQNPIPDDDLEKILASIRWVRSVNRRVVACIISVGG